MKKIFLYFMLLVGLLCFMTVDVQAQYIENHAVFQPFSYDELERMYQDQQRGQWQRQQQERMQELIANAAMYTCPVVFRLGDVTIKGIAYIAELTYSNNESVSIWVCSDIVTTNGDRYQIRKVLKPIDGYSNDDFNYYCVVDKTYLFFDINNRKDNQ